MICDYNFIVCKVLLSKLRTIHVAVCTRKCCEVNIPTVKSDICAKLLLLTDLSSASEAKTHMEHVCLQLKQNDHNQTVRAMVLSDQIHEEKM